MFTEGKRVINGTWGEVWLDSELVAECYEIGRASCRERVSSPV